MPWNLVPYVAGPFALAALIVLAILKAYQARLRRDRQLIEQAPPDERAELVDRTLDNYNLKTEALARDQRFDLAKLQLEYREKKSRRAGALVLALVLILAAVLVVFLVLQRHGALPGQVHGYHVKSSTIVYDLRKRNSAPTPESPSVVNSDKFDVVLRAPSEGDDFRSISATSGDALRAKSPSHELVFQFKELTPDPMFNMDLKHTYSSTLPASSIAPSVPTLVHVAYTYINAFTNDKEEWIGSRPSYDTDVLTLIALLPMDKPVKRVTPFLKPTSEGPRPYTGPDAVCVSADRRTILWQVRSPTPNVGYAVKFEW